MSTEPRYKVCPACHAEYMPLVARCADCDVELVSDDTLPSDEVDLDAFPPAAELDCVRVAPIPWIRALSEALQHRGVAHRVEAANADDAPDGQRPDSFGDVRLFGLYVQQAHAAAARELDACIAAQLLQEEAPPLPEGEADACPACDSVLAADATECPDCGLNLE
ncbi:MAG: hypothetical protein OEM49_01995 [Myxococcales bacterium]|nr:hypothetical protein [Myxococcales bacterium]MDH5307148.1 hypothetical protein [Myxococcales bacterium]MDH5566444.1 hypothetical protein [Myxococcales bacterium]